MAKIPKEQPPPGFSYAKWEWVRQQGALQQEGRDFVHQRAPADRIAWLLEFIREDLGKLTPDERALRSYILRAFPVGGREYVVGPMADQTLRTIQRRIAEGVQGLCREATWRLPGPSEVWLFGFGGPRYGKDGTEVPRKLKLGMKPQWGRDEVGAILYGVAELLRTAGENLRACVTCGSPFIGKKRAIYCPFSECGQKRRDAKKRAAKAIEQVQGEKQRAT